MTSQPLGPGSRVGPYEIVSPLGRGGMGEVWRARDPRLDREVAIKVLPPALAHDPERLARFGREARLLAALNHPHIGGIYGLEEAGGAPALVLELVEGETLGDLIDRRQAPLPADEALPIARQITEALEAAHDRGIVHRDLKPANIKVSPAGVVKVLDFGLGRATGPSSGPDGSMDATALLDGSLPGTILGTAAYMSPEQARGGTVDERTDIWAFGCVLYEMLTGVRTFAGDSLADTLAQVITREPDWARLPGRTPSSLRRLLRRCLQKDARQRLRDIGDARLELEEALAPGDAADPAATLTRPAGERRLMRLTDSTGTVGSPAFSPDGKMVAFVALAGGKRQVWVRMLAGGAPLQVTRDPADHDEPRWMPDSSTLVYYAPAASGSGGHLWQISALGGPPRRIAPAMGGGDVSRDGRHVAFFQQREKGMALVVAALDGSTLREVATVPPEQWCDLPRWSPDGRRIAYRRAAVLFDTRLEVVDSGGGEPQTVVRSAWLRGHAWLPDGSGLVYSSSTGSTMAYPPTNNLRAVGGDGTGDRQLTFGDVSYFEPDVDAAGRVLANREQGRSDVWRFPIEGSPAENVRDAVQVTRQTGRVQVPAISPDGREMVYVSDSGGHANLWLASLDGTSLQQLTFDQDPAVSVAMPLWAPTGDRILLLRAIAGRIDICLVDRDGGSARTLVHGAYGPCWSPDGRSVYFCPAAGRIDRLDLGTGAVVPVLSERATGPAIPLNGGPLYYTRLADILLGARGESEVHRAATGDGPDEVLARIANSRVPLAPRLFLHFSASPDGRWLSIPLLDGTTANIWLVPTGGGPMQAVTDFGDRPVFIARQVSWSPDSRYVYAAVAEPVADVVLLEGLLG